MTDYLDTSYLTGPSLLSLKSGEDRAVEIEAAIWLARSREGVTALADKRDYLTKDQLALRAKKEVLNHTGFSDESVMSGLFKREYNPLAGTRPTGRMRRRDD